MAKNTDFSSLIRQAGQDLRRDLQNETGGRTSSEGIFDILSYIESDWGLQMRLFPAQRAIVKLYYFLELDDFLPEEDFLRIHIRDVLTGDIRYTLTEKQYISFLYNEGRCNVGEQDHERRQLLLAIGRRGGKCVSPDSLVLTSQGVYYIEDLIPSESEGYLPFEVGVAQEKGLTATSTHFYNGGVQPTFEIKSRDGYSIRGTAEHRVKVLTSEGTVDWRFLDEIQVGDCLAINRSTNLWKSDYLDVRHLHNDHGRKDLSFPDVLDEKWGLLLGYLVGDGSWTHTQDVSVTVEHSETWDRLKDLYTDLFGSYQLHLDTRTENTGSVRFSSVGMRSFLKDLGWSTSSNRYGKKIPWSIRLSPRSVVCAFLKGLFETDGSAESSGRKVTFSTASFELAREVQVLLLNLGIVSSVRKKWSQKTKRHYANLTLKGVRSRRLFARYIGFDSEKKQKPFLASLETAQEGKSDTESLPHQYHHIRELLEAVPKRNPALGEKGWGRCRLREALGNACKPGAAEDITYSRLESALGVARSLGVSEDKLEHFKELLDLDYYYDPVATIELGEDQVYDLCVPEGETFVANGLTNHNTALSSIFASYEVYRLLNLYNPQEYYGLPNGDRIQIISVGTDKEQAAILFNNVAGHLAKCDYFKPYQANNTQSQVNFRTPYDIEKFGSSYREQGKYTSFSGKASIRLTFKGATGKGLRGPGNIVIILDEFAHFLDTGPASAAEIYEAVTPSAATFSPKDPENSMLPTGDPESRIICISSPLGKSGKFYKLYDQAMRNDRGSKNMLAIQAPTWEINPTVPLTYLQEKYYAGPTAFSTEFGANFNDQISGWIEREEDLLACIDPAHRPLFQAQPRVPHNMGIDLGLTSGGDGTYMAITHVENDKIVLDYHEGWRAGISWRETNPHLSEECCTDYAKTLAQAERLDFEEVGKWVKAISRRFMIREGLFDSWNGIPLEQYLHKNGLKQFRSELFPREFKSRIFQATKMMIFDEKLKLYDFPLPEKNVESGGSSRHAPYIAELLSLQAKKISKNIVEVEAPNKDGAHDDFSDALVRSVWLSISQLTGEKYVSHGQGVYRPHTATASGLNAYQLQKARFHGTNPRAKLNARNIRFVR